jgi:hypothetical protein
VDADAHLEFVELAAGHRAALVKSPLDRKGRQKGAANMVFVSKRRAEQRHEPVAGKLRCGAAEPTDLGEARVEKRADEIAHTLGPETFGKRRGVDDVAKQHGDLFHLAGNDADP